MALAKNLGFNAGNVSHFSTRSMRSASISSYDVTFTDNTQIKPPLTVTIKTISINNSQLGDSTLDYIAQQNNAKTYHAQGANDIVDVIVQAITELTLDEDNQLTGTDDNDKINGRAGNDEILGHKGDDIIEGGKGNDILYGNEGNDSLNGGAGDDRLFGGNGNDLLDGGQGDDVLEGNDGDDIFNDIQGKNTLIGGNGWDIYNIARAKNTTITDKDGVINIDSDIVYIPWGNWGKMNMPSSNHNGMSLAAESDLANKATLLYFEGEGKNQIGH